MSFAYIKKVFIGHFAVAYAAKRVAPRASLGWTFAACQFADLLWPILVLAGVEHVRVDPGNTAFTPLAFDWITHRPDMPLAPGVSTKVGLGLWNSVAATIGIETAMYVAVFWIYMRSTREADKTGVIAAWWLGGFLLASYIGNTLTRPPQDPRAVAWGALAMWILVPVAAWIDRHRTA